MASTICPRCGIATTLQVFPPFPDGDQVRELLGWAGDVNMQQQILNQSGPWTNFSGQLDVKFRDAERNERWRMAACHNCGRPFISIHDADYKLLRVLPPQAAEVSKDVPEMVRADLEEAGLCVSMGAYKAGVTMYRRALEGAAVDKGADPKKRLADQLKELQGKGILHQALVDAAREIRLLGNYGAHPSDDGLDKVQVDEAKVVGELTHQVLEDLYVNPARTARLRNRGAVSEAAATEPGGEGGN